MLRLIALFPQDSSASGARPVLADLYRQQNRLADEARVLDEHVTQTADDLTAAVRLMQLHVDGKDWLGALKAADTVMAIDPANPEVLRQLVDVAIAAEQPELAVRCLRGLLELDPSVAPRWRYRMAELLQADDPAEARSQILRALESAPRFRAAHRLLLQLQPARETDAPD